MKRFNVLPSLTVLFVFSLTVWGLVPSVAEGAVPKLINFQGVLKDSAGNTPAVDMLSVTFTIYDAPLGGAAFWTETHSITISDGGRFNVLLGSFNPIPDSVFADTVRWLGIKVETDPEEMTPRQQLASVGYAYRVGTVDGASGGTITSKVSIGPFHTNTGANAIVVGDSNIATGTSAFVAGKNNRAYGDYSVVAGGGGTALLGAADANTALGGYSAVGGGRGNTASSFATVGGGFGNTASGFSATIGGGYQNTASGQEASTVGGGFQNVASGFGGTVGGGGSNRASSFAATVGGGDNNIASGQRATVAGGSNNTASGFLAAIGGGDSHLAGGDFATVSGGWRDTASGYISTVPGGYSNRASGNYSFAAGRRAKAVHLGSFVWADSSADADFASTGNNQFLIRAAGGVGIGTASPNSKLQVNGPIATAVTTVNFSGGSGNFNVDDSHSILFIRAEENSPSSFTVTLPAPTGLAGRQYTIKRTDAATASVTIQSASDLIDGTPNKPLNGQYKYLVLVSDGQSWFIVANN